MRCRYLMPVILVLAAFLAGQRLPTLALAEDDLASLREKVDLALEPPRVNLEPGPQYADENRRNCNMVIGADRTPGGRIWACWVSGGDNDRGYFVVATSDDNGETWSGPRMVIDPSDHPSGLRRRALVGNLWTDPKGRLWLFFDQSMGYFDGRAGDWYIRCDNPDAPEPAWTTPKRIWHGCTLQKPTVLGSGEWLLPISLWQRYAPKWGRQLFAHLDDQRKAWVFVSRDEGQSWHKLGGVRFPHFNFDEHMVVELADGRLWMTARTWKGIYQSFSADCGNSWTKPTFYMHNANSRHFIRRLQSGKILLVKNGKLDEGTPRTVGKYAPRTNLTAYLSDDEGQTWHGGLAIESIDRRCTYPDGFQAPNGQIFIIYDHERTKAKEILMARFCEQDIRAGKLVAEGSKLRMLVNKAGGRK